MQPMLKIYLTVSADSVLILCNSYPNNITLGNYLKHAIQDGILSVSVFVATFLQAAHSPDLQNSSTLDLLCRIALDAHYSSGLPPIGSVISYSESPIVLLGTIQDALALLRTAHSLPISHQLTTSASELVILLLSCVTDISQVSTAQALVHYADASDMLHTLSLTPDVRHVLETFVMSLRHVLFFHPSIIILFIFAIVACSSEMMPKSLERHR
jgi:mediator of RNA polymerase II transcription subunit 5